MCGDPLAPLVSIVLPTYNGERHVGETIESCVGQTYRNLELIIVEDGSTDGTLDVVKRYLERDQRLRLLRHECNRKLPAALNTGFASAAGPYLTWISDDNIFRRETIGELVAFLEARPDVDIVYTDCTLIDDEGNPFGRLDAGEPDRLLSGDFNCVGPCFLYRRRVQEVLGGYAEDMFLVEDYDFWLRASNSFRLKAYHKDLFYYRRHRGSLSSRFHSRIDPMLDRAMARHLALAGVPGSTKAALFFMLARRARGRGEAIPMLTCLANSWSHSPPVFAQYLGRAAQRNFRRRLRWVESAYAPQLRLRASKTESAPARALEWVRRHESPSGGIFVDSTRRESYPEVTGYLVPTLLQHGERELAARLLRWLVRIQRETGAFPDPVVGLSNVFDTGQVLRGLLAGVEIVPQALDAARRAADYLCAQMQDGGRGGFGDRYRGGTYGPGIPESIHLYVLPPLCHAAKVFQQPRYQAAAEACCAHYASHEDALDLRTLTHYLAYELEALIDLGHAALVTPVLERLRAEQRPDGAVPATAADRWVCAPGLAQVAICWYKLGLWDPADRAVGWLETHQEISGGFLGGYGEGAWYFVDEEPSWAAKFFLDAHLLRRVSYFNREAATVPSSISNGDGRVKAILSVVAPHDEVLEVGCGNGRFLKALREAHPGIRCTGVDISEASLAHVPPDIRTLRGSLETIPCREDSFDVVVAVETIEHSPNMQAAVQELVRVTRPGGWVVIVHKKADAMGQTTSPSWMREPPGASMSRWLRRDCDRVTAEPVPCEDRLPPAGLMVAWKGQKRSRGPATGTPRR